MWEQSGFCARKPAREIRRTPNRLGATVWVLAVLLGTLMPLMGASLIVVLFADWVWRRFA